MKYTILLNVRLIAIILLFIFGLGYLFIGGFNYMSVLFITSSFGGYSLMNIFSLFNKNQFMFLFSKQLIVLMGLLCAVLLFLYAYFTSKLTNVMIPPIVVLFTISIIAIVARKFVMNKK